MCFRVSLCCCGCSLSNGSKYLAIEDIASAILVSIKIGLKWDSVDSGYNYAVIAIRCVDIIAASLLRNGIRQVVRVNICKMAKKLGIKLYMLEILKLFTFWQLLYVISSLFKLKLLKSILLLFYRSNMSVFVIPWLI
jgi:hypothetical protein